MCEEPSGLAADAQQWDRSLPVDNRTQAPHHSPCLRKATAGRGHLVGPLPPPSATRYIRRVFWLTRPPYLRWAAAVVIVVAAFAWDMRGRAEVLYPFASNPISAGSPIVDSEVEWRSVPADVMASPDLSDPVATRNIEEGEPIVPSAVSGEAAIPDGWWAVPLALPASATAGSQVWLVGTASGLETEGIVVAAGSNDLLSYDAMGMVAVPPEVATAVAVESNEGSLVVLVDP